MVRWAVRVVVLVVASVSVTQAQPVTEPAGFYKLTLLGNSDSFVSLPFTRPEAASAQVYGTNATQIQVQGNPGWTVNQWVYQGAAQSNTYYLFIRSGAKSGNYYTITSNSADQVTLDLAGDNLGGIMAGDRVTIIPYWTFDTVFPGGKGIHAAPSTGNRRSEVLIPNYAANGIDQSPSATYFYLAGTNQWRVIGNTNPLTINRGTDVLLPDHYFIVRHKAATNTTMTTLGAVVMTDLILPVISRATEKQDNMLGLTRPVAVTLDGSGLVQSGAMRGSPTPSRRFDELHIFDNAIAQLDRSPSATYAYVTNAAGGAWRKVGGGTVLFGPSNVFFPGVGFRIRRWSNAVDTLSVDWTNSPAY